MLRLRLRRNHRPNFLHSYKSHAKGPSYPSVGHQLIYESRKQGHRDSRFEGDKFQVLFLKNPENSRL